MDQHTTLAARTTSAAPIVARRSVPRSFAVATALGAALAVASDLTTPHTGDGAPALVATVTAHPDRWMIGYSLQILAGILLAAGVLGFAWVAAGRGARLVRVGVVVLATGLVGLACEAATELMLVPVTAGGATRAVLDTVDRMDQSAALVVVFLVYLPGILFGPVLLGAGLARSRRTTWWAAGALAVATLAGFVLTGTVAGTVALVVQMGLLVALAAGALARGR